MISPQVVTSIEDPRVADFRDVRDRDLRGRDGLFMAESELVLRRLLRSPERIHAILLSHEKFARLEAELAVLSPEVPVLVADLQVMGEIAGFHVHRGVLATGHRPGVDALRPATVMKRIQADAACTVLLATGITNVDNMGSLFRNAAAFGVDAVILDEDCCDPLYRKAIRVSMGHVLGMPWAIAEDWISTLWTLRDHWGLTLLGAECHPGARSVTQRALPDRMGFIVGAEGAGLTPETMAVCDALVEIPMAVGVPSLNVATAAAILLWERRRGG